MRHRNVVSALAAAAASLALTGRAGAAVSYSYVADPSFTIGVPQFTPVTIKLYLLETLTNGSPSLIAADGGVFRAGVSITRVAGDGALVSLARNTADFAGTPTSLVGPGLVQFTEQVAAGASSGVATGNAGGSAGNAMPNAVYLGSVNVILGSNLASTFAITPYDANGGDTVTFGHAYDLDANSGNPSYTGARANPTVFSIVLGPEPSFAGMAAVVAAAGTLVRRRRTR